jgi:hypothetical protein
MMQRQGGLNDDGLNQTGLSIDTMCELVGVPRSSYYRYLRNRDVREQTNSDR